MVRDDAKPFRNRPRQRRSATICFFPCSNPKDRERTEREIARVIRVRRQFRRLLQGRRGVRKPGNGSARAAAWSRTRPASPRHLSGIALDIDEEKQLEEALRTRESHLRSILDTVPDAMIVIDGHGIMQFFSTAAERLFGYAEQEAIGQNVSDADARAGSRPPRRLPRALPIHRRAAHHRHRPDRDRQAPGRHDLSDAPVDRRNAIRRRALLHRLRARPDRAPADPGAAPGTAVRTGPRLAPERDGRDGVGAGARAQSAARRHQQLHEGLAPAAGRQRRSQYAENRERDGPRRRTGAARRPDHPPPARLRLARRIREARREPRRS